MLPTKIAVDFLPEHLVSSKFRGATAVVIDVFRASTVIVQALASGVQRILPCATVDEARGLADSLRESQPGNSPRVLLGGERKGLPIDGFDLGNSPGDYSEAVCSGKTFVMTTSNGTKAMLACLAAGAQRVLVTGFVNLTATARALAGESSQPPRIVCAGSEGEISLEDSLCAGFIIDQLQRLHGASAFVPGNDAAQLVCLAAARLRRELSWEHPAPGSTPPTASALALAVTLGSGLGGTRIREIGLDADLIACCQIDRFDLLADLRRPSAGDDLDRPVIIRAEVSRPPEPPPSEELSNQTPTPSGNPDTTDRIP